MLLGYRMLNLLFIYIQSVSGLGWCIVNNFRILLVSCHFFISSNLQKTLPKVHLNRGTANAQIAVILFLPFNPDFRRPVILNLVTYSFCNHSFICWCCMPSLPSVPRYLYVFPCSSFYISLLKSSIKFCEWTNCLFYSKIFSQFSSPNSIWISSLKFLLLASLCEVLPLFHPSASDQSRKVSAILASLLVVYSHPVINLFSCCFRGIKLMQINGDDNESSWYIPRCVTTSFF